MDNCILITPEELFYLGKMLNAKTIDYAYVAAMNDIGQNFALFESETKASLVKKGLLDEDFSGNVEINQNILALLNPLFFGEKEGAMDVCTIGNANKVEVYKFHFLDETITMVSGANGLLCIQQVDLLYISQMIRKLLPVLPCDEGVIMSEKEIKDNARKLVAVKHVNYGVSSSVDIFIITEKHILTEKDDGQFKSVGCENFCTTVLDIVRGV